MQVYEVTIGDSTVHGTPPRSHVPPAPPDDKKLFIADDVTSAAAAAQEWIGPVALYIRDIRDLGYVHNCYVGQDEDEQNDKRK